MHETSDAVSDPRLTTSRPAASARAAEAQSRGTGQAGTLDGSPGLGRRVGASPSTPPDAPVARPVVGEADGHVVRSAITTAATEAARHDAAERAALQARPAVSGGAVPSAPASADLTGLLDHLRLAVARHVRDRRHAGAPIERVLPEVKGLVREAAAYERWHDPVEALVRQVVGWTIAAYYDEPEPPHEDVRVAGGR